MRVLKILLIIFLLFSLVVLSGAGIYGYLNENDSPDGMFLVSVIGVGVLLGVITIYFHFRTLPYYRASKQVKPIKKFYSFFWIVALLSHIFFTLFGAFAAYGLLKNEAYTSVSELFAPLLFSFVLILYGVASIVEIILLDKRIKLRKEEQSLHTEIDEIGS